MDAGLTTAVGAKTRVPAVGVQIYDEVHHYSLYQSQGDADAQNDACIANDNSIIRVNLTRGGFTSNFRYQRITDPTVPSQWTSWTTFTGGSGNMFQDGGCAISYNSSDSTLRAFAQRGTGGNDIYVWRSSDNGATWSGPVSILQPPGSALTKGISSAGHDDVFFVYDVSGGEQIGCSFYSAGAWSALRTSTLATFLNGSGIAVIWNGTTAAYYFVYSDSYTLYTGTYTPGSTTWAAGQTVAPATSSAISRLWPRLMVDNGPTYVLTSIEYDTGVLSGSVYNYARVRSSIDFTHWSNGVLRHGVTCIYGAVTVRSNAPKTGSAGARYYCICMPYVFSSKIFSQVDATMAIDVSAALLSYKREERDGHPSKLDIVLDNNKGVYNSSVYTGSGSNAPISPGASVILNEGYKVSGVADTIKVGTYRIQQIRFERSPENNAIRLICYDFSRDLDLVIRFQMTYSNQTLQWLITEICARAGLFNLSISGGSQLTQVIPSFILQAGQTYRKALDELCSTYGLVYFMDQAEFMQFKELSSGDLIVWNYQPEIEIVSFGTSDRANHVIVSGKPPAGGNSFALTTSEAFDDNHAATVEREALLHHVDTKLTSTAQCTIKANFLMLQEQRDQVMHSIIVPANPALQLMDGINVQDYAAPTGSAQNTNCRIIKLETAFDAQHALYELHLELEGL